MILGHYFGRVCGLAAIHINAPKPSYCDYVFPSRVRVYADLTLREGSSRRSQTPAIGPQGECDENQKKRPSPWVSQHCRVVCILMKLSLMARVSVFVVSHSTFLLNTDLSPHVPSRRFEDGEYIYSSVYRNDPTQLYIRVTYSVTIAPSGRWYCPIAMKPRNSIRELIVTSPPECPSIVRLIFYKIRSGLTNPQKYNCNIYLLRTI